MDKNTVLWALVVFFGASIMFAGVRDLTQDESAGVTLLAQIGAGALLVGALVYLVRRRR